MEVDAYQYFTQLMQAIFKIASAKHFLEWLTALANIAMVCIAAFGVLTWKKKIHAERQIDLIDKIYIEYSRLFREFERSVGFIEHLLREGSNDIVQETILMRVEKELISLKVILDNIELLVEKYKLYNQVKYRELKRIFKKISGRRDLFMATCSMMLHKHKKESPLPHEVEQFEKVKKIKNPVKMINNISEQNKKILISIYANLLQ